MADGELRLADLLCALSVTLDLAMEQAPEKSIRSCLVAVAARSAAGPIRTGGLGRLLRHPSSPPWMHRHHARGVVPGRPARAGGTPPGGANGRRAIGARWWRCCSRAAAAPAFTEPRYLIRTVRAGSEGERRDPASHLRGGLDARRTAAPGARRWCARSTTCSSAGMAPGRLRGWPVTSIAPPARIGRGSDAGSDLRSARWSRRCRGGSSGAVRARMVDPFRCRRVRKRWTPPCSTDWNRSTSGRRPWTSSRYRTGTGPRQPSSTSWPGRSPTSSI